MQPLRNLLKQHFERRTYGGTLTEPKTSTETIESGRAVSPGWLESLSLGLRELDVVTCILFGIGGGVLMTVALLDPNSIYALMAGIVPVSLGLLLSKRVKGHYVVHGLVTGLFGALVSIALLAYLLFLSPWSAQLIKLGATGSPSQELLIRGLLPAFMLIFFTTFGASTSGRIEERNRNLRQEVNNRGGQLERPGSIREADDIRGLSLPQLGWYANNLFKKKGFTFKDYRFIDKDKHLDIWLEHEGQPWHMRLSVADKITPGTIESLLQEMRREGIQKGVVITSTEFTPAAQKAAKDRPVVLIDGPSLFEIGEG